MRQHTRGRWGFGDKHEICAIDSDQLNAGYFIAICEGPDKEANARRIVAAVNACQNFTTQELEEVGENFSGVLADTRQRCWELIAQRDELLAALKDARSQIYNLPHTSALENMVDGIEAAIAKCEAK